MLRACGPSHDQPRNRLSSFTQDAIPEDIFTEKAFSKSVLNVRILSSIMFACRMGMEVSQGTALRGGDSMAQSHWKIRKPTQLQSVSTYGESPQILSAI